MEIEQQKHWYYYALDAGSHEPISKPEPKIDSDKDTVTAQFFKVFETDASKSSGERR